MEQIKNVPGPESTISERLEWARQQRQIEKPELIRTAIGWSKRSAYSNILANNLQRSKHYPALARTLKIHLKWLLKGEGDWDASAEPQDGAKQGPGQINENLLMLCYQASESFAALHSEEWTATRLELFAMTARLYEEAAPLDVSMHTEENLRKMLLQHYSRAMRSHLS